MDKIGKESHEDKGSVDFSWKYVKKYVSNKIHYNIQSLYQLKKMCYLKWYQIIHKRAHKRTLLDSFKVKLPRLLGKTNKQTKTLAWFQMAPPAELNI